MLGSLALALTGLLVIAGAVQAALPSKGASFTFHDHATPGKNWHVEFEIDSGNPRKIKTLVAYSEQCNGTIAKTGVPISDTGVIAASGGLKGYGWWEVNATFTTPTTLVGTMRMRRANCDTGLLAYPNAITGDGHSDHSSHHGEHHHGRKFPNFASATAKQRRQAMALHRRVLRKWSGMTPARARRLGFFSKSSTNKNRLGMFHVYNQRYENDKRIFDARRPESLVFWRRPKGEPVILAAMFRVARGKRPRFAGPIPLYHTHESKSGRAPRPMTHVWMVKRSARKSAWANCLPVPQLELYNPAFKWMAGLAHLKHVGEPC